MILWHQTCVRVLKHINHSLIRDNFQITSYK
nr:MAG TPA: hypothetical protein [Caudoviricetes sp.]